MTDANGYFTIGKPACRASTSSSPGTSAPAERRGRRRALCRQRHGLPEWRRRSRRPTCRTRSSTARTMPDDPGLLALLNPASCRSTRTAAAAADAVEPAVSERHGRRTQHVDLLAGHAEPGWRQHVPASAAAQQQRRRDQPALRRRRQRRRDVPERLRRAATTAARAPVDITGWSLQYASATGSGWDFNKTAARRVDRARRVLPGHARLGRRRSARRCRRPTSTARST